MYPCTRFLLIAAASTALAGGAASATAQTPAGDGVASAFHDPGALDLLARGRAARQQTEQSIRSYTAVVRSRMAAGLRMPLKDRTLFREEAATRVRWSRDDETVAQVLALRQQHPGGVQAPRRWGGAGVEQLFDPGRDRLYFGLVRDPRSVRRNDFWVEHPLGADAERHYTFATGDTISLRLQDGRVLRAIELRVTPRRASIHLVRGSLWIDAASGALVQAAYRLAQDIDIERDSAELERNDDDDLDRVPGIFKPIVFDLSLVTIEYSLWELQHWLPRMFRMEGTARAGIITVPAAMEISYTIEAVELDVPGVVVDEHARALATAREWNDTNDHRSLLSRNRRSRRGSLRLLVPRDSTALLTSDLLPLPIWEDAPGFPTSAALAALYDRVASIPAPQRPVQPPRFSWGPGGADLLRYNRVEGLSIGARAAVELPVADITLTTRLGTADLHPNAELWAHRATMHRTLSIELRHALVTVADRDGALGLGNSVAAVILGRDDGEYFRSTAIALRSTPPTARRAWYDASAYLERHDDAVRGTHVSLAGAWRGDSVFRTNIRADRALQYGARVLLHPWWGTDAAAAQAGLEIMVQAEAGDYPHGRARVALRTAVPLSPRTRLGLELGAGSSSGAVPVQRLWYLGGATTLRGYDGSTLTGTSFGRARFELARALSWGNLTLFTDAGWAGDRAAIHADRLRRSAGAGASLLDGLVRVDLARALDSPYGWKLELYLDAIL